MSDQPNCLAELHLGDDQNGRRLYDPMSTPRCA